LEFSDKVNRLAARILSKKINFSLIYILLILTFQKTTVNKKMKKIIISLLLIALAGLSIFSFRRFSNKCSKVDFSDVLGEEYIYVDERGAKTDITITFSGDGRVFGFGGVNRYFAGYKLGDGNVLTLSPIGSTMMAGSAADLDAETNYFNLLKGTNKIKTCSERIVLLTNDGHSLNFIRSDNRSSRQASDENIDSEVIGPRIMDSEKNN